MADPGYIWIEGTSVHYIDADGAERAQEGTTTGATGSKGYFWIEGDYIHYIDDDGDERFLPYAHVGTDPSEPGYIWIEGDWVHYSAEINADEKVWHSDADHSDIAHADWTEVYHASEGWGQYFDFPGYTDVTEHGDYLDVHHTNYSDIGWTDIAHGDHAHNDVGHADWTDHTNTPWSDTYEDWNQYFDYFDLGYTDHAVHDDTGYADAGYTDTSHSDSPHSDYDYFDWDDYADIEHSDVEHTDQPALV